MTAAGLRALGIASLLALVGWIYWPTLGNGFVWDDWTVVVATRAQRGLDLAGLRWAVTVFVEGHYQPLTWLSLALDDRWGAGSPYAYHAVNAAWHALNTLLTALVSWRLMGYVPTMASAAAGWARALASLLSAAAFGLHPLRVESVAWITERRDVLSACFLLLAVYAYLRRLEARPERARIWFALAVVSHALALLAKAQVALPAVLLVLDFYPLRRHLAAPGVAPAQAWRALLLEKIGFALPALVIGLVALRAQAASGALASSVEHGVAARLAQAGYGLVFYLRATCCSVTFSPLHERPYPFPWREVPFSGALALAGLAALLVVALRRRAPALAAAAAVYVLFLLPVLGLSQSGVQLVADRYSYLSCLGWTLVAAGLWGRAWLQAPRRVWRVVLAVTALCVVGGWAYLARAQTTVWRDDETLWRHVLALGPSALADNNLGQILAARGEVTPAFDHLEHALQVVPSYARPWTALYALLQQRASELPPRKAERLAATLQAAARYHPQSVVVARTLALALAQAGDTDGARWWAEEARHRLPAGRSQSLDHS